MEINQLLAKFGLSENEQAVYLLLTKRGWSTALQLARAGKVKRTTLYRVLETLAQKGLVETQIDDKTTYYNAADPQQFESLVIQEENKVKELRGVYEDLNKSMKILTNIVPGETAVRFYRGLRGLEHLLWKMCEKEGIEVNILDAGDIWYTKLGNEFAETIREEIVKKKIFVRELQNTSFCEPINDDGTCKWTENTAYIKLHYCHRLLDSNKLKITQDIYTIGEEVTHILGYRDNDIFGIEIVSKDLTGMMRQMFREMWNQAKVIDKFGGENL